MVDETENAPKQEVKVQLPDPDIEERIAGFNKELFPILGKYELGLGARALLTPDGRIAAEPVLVSARSRKKDVELRSAPEGREESAAGLSNPEA